MGEKKVTDCKKYTANGLVRRGCPDGGSPLRNSATAYSGIYCRDSHVASPLERLAITYTRMIVGFYEPRTTNHGLSSDSDAAFRRDRLKLTTTLRETLSA